MATAFQLWGTSKNLLRMHLTASVRTISKGGLWSIFKLWQNTGDYTVSTPKPPHTATANFVTTPP
ncbi:hypothetical protein GNX18_12400 [Microbulbifer sp. SH-1]|uniref:hypothetical protein n=1 Tax=Microbulbifer sp. SH-1 TaxID=2681547 RepID=UPI001409E210|nr:hypothetical protein [Microbulbifer sp. SH-1]QIL90467.1 hypothetical protein GNX18_12400 [Microbulbifer sp. SH-1]